MIWDKISQDLGLSSSFIRNASYRNNRYKTYKIGINKRKIHHPSKELKVIQRWLTNNFFYQYPVSQYSHAYEVNSSNIKNATVHRRSNFFFQTDIVNFFESIKTDMVRNLILNINNDLHSEEIEFILRVVLYKGGLTVGSPSSPAIANRIMHDFDNRLARRLSELDNDVLLFTRYSDDITISSNEYIDESIKEIVADELKLIQMTINEKKTRFSSRSSRIMITGVNIDNNTRNLTIGSKKYMSLKKEIYDFLIKDKGQKDVLIGKLSYLRSVNEEQYNQLISIFSKYKNFEKLQNK